MIIDKVIIIINVVNIVGLVHATIQLSSDGQVRMDTGNSFTLNQYTGVWYQVAIMSLTPVKSELICEWFNITAEDDCEGCFSEIYRQSLDGKSMTRFYGHGRVVDSQVHIIFPGSRSKTRILSVTSYNNNQELILRDQGNKNTSELISRKPSAPVEIRSQFEKQAMNAEMYAMSLKKC